METQHRKLNNQTKQTQLTVLPDEKISFGQSALLGLQHVMAMDVYVVPFLIAMLIGLQTGQASALIQSPLLQLGSRRLCKHIFV